VSPLANTRVIPTGWSAHHAPTAAGGMNATVTIGNTRTGTDYDPDTDETTETWSTEYDTGPARVQALNQAEQVDAAGQQVTGRAYLVQLDMNHAGADEIAPGARAVVDAAVNDAQLVGQVLWVVDVQLGSERFTRDLVCSDNQSDAPTA
jgi:hypothetical protein